MEQRLVSEDVVRWAKPRYEEYRRGNVNETVMCGEMTAMYAGVPVAEIEKLVAKFFAEVVQPNIFEEMFTLTLALKAQGCALWAVSSTNEWVIKYGIRQFGIPVENVLAAQVICNDGIASRDLVRVPSGEGKAIAIKQFVSDRVDAVFGNSIHDAAMLELASHPYAVKPVDYVLAGEAPSCCALAPSTRHSFGANSASVISNTRSIMDCRMRSATVVNRLSATNPPASCTEIFTQQCMRRFARTRNGSSD
jgi:phosphoserine phosphatase